MELSTEVTPRAILQSGFELLGPNGEHWIKGNAATYEDGTCALITCPGAVNFCSVGCIMRAAVQLGCEAWWINEAYMAAERKLCEITRRRSGRFVGSYNDSVDSFEAIKSLFHEAIAATE